MDAVRQFILDFLSTPAILIGVIILIGLIAQKKRSSEVLRGTFKGILGFLILGAGADVVVGSLQPFGSMFQEAFNMSGVVPNNEAITATALEDYGTATAIIMVIGMATNILVARFSQLKYIFLTGHHTLFMAALIAVVFKVGGLDGILLYVFGGLMLGLVMAFFPALAQPYMRKITGKDNIALGHFSTVTYVISSWIGSVVGKNSKSTEDIKFPKGLAFLRDTSVAIGLTMVVLYLIVGIAAGPAFLADELGVEQNFIIFAILQGITFAAGVYIILQGVRMVIDEIVPAFKGFSDKIVPDAKPALDIPVVYPFAPTAVLIGFLVSFLGGVVGLGILIAVGAENAILPGVVPHFFVGAGAGVFANATGGRLGTFVGAFFNGLAITFLPLLLLPVLGDLGFAQTTFGDADFTVVGSILGTLATYHEAALIVTVLVLISLPFLHQIFIANKRQPEDTATESSGQSSDK
ncbi:MAG: PTS ascorbate transporter subunit IIC [Bacillota bacterium]